MSLTSTFPLVRRRIHGFDRRRLMKVMSKEMERKDAKQHELFGIVDENSAYGGRVTVGTTDWMAGRICWKECVYDRQKEPETDEG